MTPPSATVCMVEPFGREINAPILMDLAADGLTVPYFRSLSELERSGVALEAMEVLITSACPRVFMDRTPRLRAVINPYIGCEHIDRAAANERRIIIGNGAAVENVVGVAEATILLLLACFFDFAESERVLREQRPRPPVTARLLMGKTVGIVGYGRIAQQVAKRLAPWELDLLISAPRLHAPLPPGARHVALDDLLARSDAILVLCSLNDETRNLLSRDRLQQVKPSAVLVNTARGGIVDEAALAEMLCDGRLRKAALDVFEIEPLPGDSALRQAPNAILTPHMIGHNVEAEEAMARIAAESVRRVLSGRPPVHVFNPETLDAWSARTRRTAHVP